MTLTERLEELVRAGFPGVYVTSHEHDDALADIAALCRRKSWPLAAWDLDHGLVRPSSPAGTDIPAPDLGPGPADPVAALRALPGLATPDGAALLVLRNPHRLLGSPELIQALDTALAAAKPARLCVVILAPVCSLPPELERQFVLVEHELPGRDALLGIARGVATEPGELPAGAELDAVLEAAAGLTRLEAEGAFALSLVRYGRLEPPALWELKAQALKRSGLLSLHRGGESFADLGGLQALKAFCSRALRPSRRPDVQARGLLLLGVPGTGKSALAKAIGTETGRPTIGLDVGALMGSLVGETESRVRSALQQIDAMAPCVVLIDEVEKALAGGADGGRGDSGVGARLFGALLSWLNDRTADAFVVCTANDVSRLPPEFARAQRFDGIFFLDLPGPEGREAIWRQYLARYGLDPMQARPDCAGWTGAEIQACCRLAALLDEPLRVAARQVVPVAHTAAESIERLRAWAAGRCLDADRPGLYTRGPEPKSSRPGRGLRARPSEN